MANAYHQDVEEQLVGTIKNLRSGAAASLQMEDSLDLQRHLKNLVSGERTVWAATHPGVSKYSEKEEEWTNKVAGTTKEVMLKAGDIPLTTGTFKVRKGETEHHPRVFVDTDKDIDTVMDQVRERVEDSGVKIPEKLAKYAGASQAAAGGEFEIDRDIDDFDDALRAFGANNIKIKPLEKAKKAVSSENDAMKNSSKMGLGLLAAGAALYTVYRWFT